jgi:EAL domain-containing protein (putative c-di-GMP-specific phosphodiesterase class I)
MPSKPSPQKKLRWTGGDLESPPPPLAVVPESGVRRVTDIKSSDLDVVFQPIVDLRTGRPYAYEALTRCRWPEFRNPAHLFEEAARAEFTGRLGRAVREVAFSRGARVPLFVNLHPQELSARWLVRPDDPLFLHDHELFLEITESAPLRYANLCDGVLKEVCRRSGAHLVVDDLGAGYSNLYRIVELEPRVVKLDVALVRELHLSRRQQVLIRHVVRLCEELGALVVAEGIESIEEFHAVRDTGAQLGQGYLLARPAWPIPDVSWPS